MEAVNQRGKIDKVRLIQVLPVDPDFRMKLGLTQA
jgi:hypothetical protein